MVVFGGDFMVRYGTISKTGDFSGLLGGTHGGNAPFQAPCAGGGRPRKDAGRRDVGESRIPHLSGCPPRERVFETISTPLVFIIVVGNLCTHLLK